MKRKARWAHSSHAWFAIACVVASLGCGSLNCSVATCDLRETRCQREIMRSTACLRGQQQEEIPVTVLRREQYAAEVVSQPVSEEAERRFVETQQAYALLDLENGNVSSRGISQGLVGTIGAFYDSRTDEIVILHDGEPLDSLRHGALLAHEFAHALQSRHSSLSTEGIETSDELLAALAVVEGDAAWTEDRFYALGAGRKSEDIQWDPIFDRWTQESEIFYRRQSSRVRLASRFFIYSFGSRYLQDLYLQGGQAALDAQLLDPPRASIDIVSGQRVDRTDDREQVSERAVPVLEGAQLLSVDSLGWWVLSRGSVLGAAIRARGLDPDRFGWRGDSLSLWARQADREPLAALRVRFDGDVDAQIMSELLRGGSVEETLSIVVEGPELILLATDDRQWLDELRETPPVFGAVAALIEQTSQEENTSEFEALPNSAAAGLALGHNRLWCPRALD